MTTLVFNDQGLPVATEQWTAAQRGSEYITIFFSLNLQGRISVQIPFVEFLTLIAEGGKIVDLRKLQEEK
jgi:hypothetical protein